MPSSRTNIISHFHILIRIRFCLGRLSYGFLKHLSSIQILIFESERQFKKQ
ncbi:hypothetical protein KFK09_018385 [Dendrobium nobile]|uniref:Uncharacterized protein n=1 Tax=Dendrobium nobile TaxID=94219 RepID=A0A8T3AU89_DENNO|nr:hypothetical protein KFK09_018385 [Dendrobium nobile]